MRISIPLCIVAVAGCATAGSGPDGDRMETGIVSFGSRNGCAGPAESGALGTG